MFNEHLYFFLDLWIGCQIVKFTDHFGPFCTSVSRDIAGEFCQWIIQELFSAYKRNLHLILFGEILRSTGGICQQRFWVMILRWKNKIWSYEIGNNKNLNLWWFIFYFDIFVRCTNYTIGNSANFRIKNFISITELETVL